MTRGGKTIYRVLGLHLKGEMTRDKVKATFGLWGYLDRQTLFSSTSHHQELGVYIRARGTFLCEGQEGGLRRQVEQSGDPVSGVPLLAEEGDLLRHLQSLSHLL